MKQTLYLLLLLVVTLYSSCDVRDDDLHQPCPTGYVWDDLVGGCVYQLQIGQAIAHYAPTSQCYQLDLNGDGFIENELWDLGGHKGPLGIQLNTSTSRVAIVTYVTAFPQVPYCSSSIASGQITGIVGYFYW